LLKLSKILKYLKSLLGRSVSAWVKWWFVQFVVGCELTKSATLRMFRIFEHFTAAFVVFGSSVFATSTLSGRPSTFVVSL